MCVSVAVAVACRIFADLDSNYQSLPRDKDSAAKQAPSLPKFGNYFGSAQQQQQQQSEEVSLCIVVVWSV